MIDIEPVNFCQAIENNLLVRTLEQGMKKRAVFFATVAAATLAFVCRSHFSQYLESSTRPTPAARIVKRTTPPITPAAPAHRGGGGTLDVLESAVVTAVQPGAKAKVTTVDCGWKDEPELVGTCGSLREEHKFKHATRKQRSKSADDCASHCCEMGDKVSAGTIYTYGALLTDTLLTGTLLTDTLLTGSLLTVTLRTVTLLTVALHTQDYALSVCYLLICSLTVLRSNFVCFSASLGSIVRTKVA